MNIPFKEALIRQSGLRSLSQSDCDLFLIAQANSITYSQLSLTGLHGSTKTGGRFSLKQLEKEGYLLARVLPGSSGEKYFLLSTKGKKRVEKLFGTNFLNSLSVELDRRPPASTQLLPHRIRTGDLYFAYLANPSIQEIPAWRIEAPCNEEPCGMPSPRCDAMLSTAACTYYIEQDNNTQGDAVLSSKLRQYMASPYFLGSGLQKRALVFTVNCESHERSTAMPPFSVYRILLKTQRVWRCLEAELGLTLSFRTFCMQFESSHSPSLAHLSGSDRKLLQRLSCEHPSLRLEDLTTLKNSYLHDSSLSEEHREEQSLLFNRRLNRKFYPLLDRRESSTLRQRLRNGMSLFVLPNHRIGDFLPFVMQKEYGFGRFLLQILRSMGIETDQWTYHENYILKESSENAFLFRNAFTSKASQTLIAAEDIVHDLGGRERMRHFLAEFHAGTPILFVLFVSSRDDAVEFFAQNKEILHRGCARESSLCFLDASFKLYLNPSEQMAYYKSGPLWLPARLVSDRATGDIFLTGREVD